MIILPKNWGYKEGKILEEYVFNHTKKDIKMGGRYESTPTEVTAGFVVYPAGDYEVEIMEPTGSEYVAANEKKAGIRVPLRFTNGEFKGKTVSYFGDELNEFGRAANKRLLMAAEGIEKITDESEKAWNEKHRGDLYGFNTQDKTVDAGWLVMKGKAVIVTLDIKAATDGSGKQYQSFKAFRPIGTIQEAA